MTRIAVDCEFNSFGGQLISMALVTEHGDEWYMQLELPDNLDPWVAEHVVPVLYGDPVTRDEFRMSLSEFLHEQHDPVIVADWYTDLMHFFECFQGADHSQSMHIPLKAELLSEKEWLPSAVPHNALHDARAIMQTLLHEHT